MASSNHSPAVYFSVIEDVVANVREEFITYGVGDAVLNELQALWETKMRQCYGAISGNVDLNRPPAAAAGLRAPGAATAPPVHDLNVPYEATSDEYATPTAEMLFPPTPIHTPLPGTTDAGMDNVPTGPSARYGQFFFPGAVPTEDYKITPAAAATPRPRNDTGYEDDDEPPLNEDDDDDDETDDDDDDDDDDDEPSTEQHLVLAQFERVKRAKNRWKCTLKDGIMHLNGRDVLFNKASGEFEF